MEKGKCLQICIRGIPLYFLYSANFSSLQVCDSSFSKKRFLKNHMDRIHLKIDLDGAQKDIPFRCADCDASFARKDRLMTHMKRIHFTWY